MQRAVVFHRGKQAPPLEHLYEADRGSFWLPNIVGYEAGIWPPSSFLHAAEEDPQMALARKNFALLMRGNDADPCTEAQKASYAKVPEFNREQKDFFEAVFYGKVYVGPERISRSSLVLLQGFPGNGKKLTLAYATAGLMLLQQKVMITAQPNRGVEAIFDDVLSLFAAQPLLSHLAERAVYVCTVKDEKMCTDQVRYHGVKGASRYLQPFKYAKYSLAYRT